MFFSPFEGFKIASWSFEMINITEDYFFLTSDYLWTWNFENSINNFSWFWIFLFCAFIALIGNFLQNYSFSNIFDIFIIFLVIITFTSLKSTSSLLANELSLINDSGINQNLISLESYVFEFIFNKDIWGFFLIILFFYLLSSGSLTNLTLFPKGYLSFNYCI